MISASSCTAYVGLCSKGGSDAGELCLLADGEGEVTPLWVPPGWWIQPGFCCACVCNQSQMFLCCTHIASFKTGLRVLDSPPRSFFKGREMVRGLVCFLSGSCSRRGAEDSEHNANRSSETRLMRGCHRRIWSVHILTASTSVLVLHSGVQCCRLLLCVSCCLNAFQLDSLLGTSPSHPVGRAALYFGGFWRYSVRELVDWCSSKYSCRCWAVWVRAVSLERYGASRWVVCKNWESHLWSSDGGPRLLIHGKESVTWFLRCGWTDGWMGLSSRENILQRIWGVS